MTQRRPLLLVGCAAIVSFLGSCVTKETSADAKKSLDPDPVLQVDDAGLEDMIDKHTFDFFDDTTLYSNAPNEIDSFTAPGLKSDKSACDAKLILRPAKTAGRMKQETLDKHKAGYVIARVDNTTPDCRALTKLYGTPVGGGSAVLVVRRAKGNNVEAKAVRFPSGTVADMVDIAFKFCNHNQPPHHYDRAEHNEAGPNEDPCDVVHKSGDDSSEPSEPPPFGMKVSFAWFGCWDNCCPASSPPDTSLMQERINPSATKTRDSVPLARRSSDSAASAKRTSDSVALAKKKAAKKP